jgi:hypothetical protein
VKPTPLTRAAAVAVAIGLTIAMAALSRVPYRTSSDDHALIRLSWRTPGAFVNECRTPTPEELASLPVHMRRDQVCEGRILPNRLRVTLNGDLIIDEAVRAAGAREDRPLYVFREIAVPPGEHRVHLTWGVEGASAQLPQTLDSVVRLAPGEITLFTYDVDRRALVVRGGAATIDPVNEASTGEGS